MHTSSSSSYHLPFRGLPFEVRSMIWTLSTPSTSSVPNIYPSCSRTPRNPLREGPKPEPEATDHLLSALRIAQSCQEARIHILTSLFIRRPIILRYDLFSGLKNLATVLPVEIRGMIKEIVIEPEAGERGAVEKQIRQARARGLETRIRNRQGHGASDADDHCLRSKSVTLAHDLGIPLHKIVLQAPHPRSLESTKYHLQTLLPALIHGQLGQITIRRAPSPASSESEVETHDPMLRSLICSSRLRTCSDPGCASRIRYHQPALYYRHKKNPEWSWGSRCPAGIHDVARKFEQLGQMVYERLVGDWVLGEMREAVEGLEGRVREGQRAVGRNGLEGTGGGMAMVSSWEMAERGGRLVEEVEGFMPVRMEVGGEGEGWDLKVVAEDGDELVRRIKEQTEKMKEQGLKGGVDDELNWDEDDSEGEVECDDDVWMAWVMKVNGMQWTGREERLERLAKMAEKYCGFRQEHSSG